jgi:DNA-binding LacI/PurR family transcriptional regulator
MREKKTTIVQVARAAGVSVGTVSRVFNGCNVDVALAERVRRTAEQLRYRPNFFARHLQAKRNGTIGILLHDLLGLDTVWVQRIVLAVVKAISDGGNRSMLALHPVGETSPPDLLNMVDGCLVWGSFSDDLYRNIAREIPGIPLVSYSSPIPYPNSAAVMIRSDEAARMAFGHLIGFGHRRIAVVAGHKMHDLFEEQRKCFDAFGIPFPVEFSIRCGNPPPGKTQFEIGEEAVRRLLSSSAKRPTAIVFGSDLLAAGGMDAARSVGLAIPGDLSMIGFDDMPEALLCRPKLTTVGFDAAALAKEWTLCLENLIRGHAVEPVRWLSRPLSRRESVAP